MYENYESKVSSLSELELELKISETSYKEKCLQIEYEKYK